MSERARLPHRRRCQTFEIWHQGLGFTATVGFYLNGRIGEIFLSSHKPGSAVESVARDGAIITSIALQFGAELETIRLALTKDHDGRPATILGRALEAIEAAR
jgi:hypothetical protein